MSLDKKKKKKEEGVYSIQWNACIRTKRELQEKESEVINIEYFFYVRMEILGLE